MDKQKPRLIDLDLSWDEAGCVVLTFSLLFGEKKSWLLAPTRTPGSTGFLMEWQARLREYMDNPMAFFVAWLRAAPDAQLGEAWQVVNKEMDRRLEEEIGPPVDYSTEDAHEGDRGGEGG